MKFSILLAYTFIFYNQQIVDMIKKTEWTFYKNRKITYLTQTAFLKKSVKLEQCMQKLTLNM